MASSTQHQQPLLDDGGSDDVEIQLTAPPSASTRKRSPAATCLAVFCLMALVIVVSAVGYLAHKGAFNKLDEGDLKIVNSTVTEPNSQTTFPVQYSKTLAGLPQPAGSAQRITGVALATTSLGHAAHIKVMSMALYLDRIEARKTLQQYRKSSSKNPLPPQPDKSEDGKRALAKFVHLVAQNSLIYQQHMLIGVPGTGYQTEWIKRLVPAWRAVGATDVQIKLFKTCMLDWFSARVSSGSAHVGDVYRFEYVSKTQVMRMDSNGKLAGGECKSASLLAHGLLKLEFDEHGSHLVNLLVSTFWDAQYDKV